MSEPLSGYYSLEKFIDDLKRASNMQEPQENVRTSSLFSELNKISKAEEEAEQLENLANYFDLNTENNNKAEFKYKSPTNKNENELRQNVYNSLSYLNDDEDINEQMKIEITNLRKENSELKFCLKNLNQKFDSQIKTMKLQNELKNKELKESKNIITKNMALIELLNDKISTNEKILNKLIEENSQNIKNIPDQKTLNLIDINKKLNLELESKNKLIENIKIELDTKNDIFSEIDNMKNEMESYLQTMENLYKENESLDETIKQLKQSTIIVQKNYQEEINLLKSNNDSDKLLSDLKTNEEKETKLKKELSNLQNNYNEMIDNNQKMEKLTIETKDMIKTAIDSKKNLKQEYEKAIKELVEKYEKQINFMKLVLAKQAEEFQKNENNEKEQENNEKNDEKSNLEAMKLIKENKNLIEENEELKNMNETIMKKMRELPNLEKKFTDLFETVKLLKEENDLLKQAKHYTTLLEKEEDKMKKIQEEDTPTKNEQNPKNSLLEEDDNEKKNEPKIEEKKVVFKNIPNDKINENKSNDNSLNEDDKKNNFNNISKEINTITHTEEENEEKEEDNNSVNNENNKINPNFNLYKPTKDCLLTFNLAKKNYYTIVPENYNTFLESYNAETSIQYNTLEGLFVINKNRLFYYSAKKNSFNELFNFNEDHSFGCIFLDSDSKNIFTLGGKFSKLVEKFSFEKQSLEQLPQLNYHLSEIGCCQLDSRIYCFFGLCEERPNENIIQYLDLENLDEKWVDVIYEKKTSFDYISKMSIVNLNNNELLIIGGVVNGNVPNEKLLYYNVESSQLIELDKDLPDSEYKNYSFSSNNIFNTFLNDELISYANIDDNDQVHIIDNELKYDLYLTPKN